MNCGGPVVAGETEEAAFGERGQSQIIGEAQSRAEAGSGVERRVRRARGGRAGAVVGIAAGRDRGASAGGGGFAVAEIKVVEAFDADVQILVVGDFEENDLDEDLRLGAV